MLILLGIFAIPCDAIAETMCPDMPRASYEVLDGKTVLSAFWVIPLKTITKSTGYAEKWRKLVNDAFANENFWSDRGIQYSCFGTDCMSIGKRKFQFKGDGANIIPNRSGGITQVDSRIWEQSDIKVACKSQIAWRFKIYEIYELASGRSQLPYLILKREFKAIKVKNYGPTPSF